MKNFTKQNFKTNPLWIRLLIMSFMVLLSTGSAWADVFLAGTFNNWNASDNGFKFVDGTCSVNLSAGSHEFKVVENGTWYGNTGTITATVSGWTFSNTGNCKITVSTAGTYVFKWVESTNKLSVTYPTKKTYSATIKYKRPSNWSAVPNIHIFANNDNTLVNNQAMTLEGTDTSGNAWYKYSYSISTAFTSATIMFNINNWGSKTDEAFKITLGTDYCLTGTTVTTATCPVYCTPPAAPTLNSSSTTVCSGTSFDLPSGYRWYTVATGGTKLSSNTISNGVTQQTIYYAEAGEGGCVSTSRTAYTVNVDAKSALTLTYAETNICKGDEVELNSFVYSHTGTVTWYNSSSYVDSNKAPEKVSPTSTHKYYATAKNGVCPIKEMQLNVIVKSAPTKPVVTLTPADGNIISGNSATLSVTPQTDVTFTLYKDGVSTGDTGNSFTISEAGAYYVIGTDECGQGSPESDSKTITVCTIGSTLNSAEYDAATQKVSLEGTFELCGKESFHGFQWRKEGSDWCEENVPTDNSAYVMLGRTTEGGTKSGEYTIEDQNSAYVFRTYVVPVGGAFIYGNEITVTPCITVATPDVTVAPVCAGNEAVLTLSNRQNGVTYELGGTEIFANGVNTYSVKPEKTTTYTITATSAISCVANQKASTDVELEVIARPESPEFESNSMTVCEGEPFTLPTPTNLKVGTEDCIWSVGGKTTTGSQPGISQKTIYTAVKNDGCPSPSEEFTVNVTPKPTITAPKTSCAPYDEITLTSAGGANTTWQATGGILSATTGESVTFKAPAGEYTITASANGCEDTETITVACAEEVCNNTLVTDDSKFQIWCKSTLTGSLYLHIWYEKGNSDVNITSWPGTKVSKDGNYFKWEFSDIESGSNIGYIFHDNTDNNKTPDANKTLYKGKRYNFTYNGGKNAATVGTEETLTKPGVAITTPTVKTVSAVQKDGEPVVVIKGFLQAKGCADITKYGFEYKQEGAANFTDVQVTGSKNNCEEWELECDGLEFGETYIFRAKATNSDKEGTGEEIRVTIQGQSTPVVIKAIRNDKTINTSHWADFVALYVENEGIDLVNGASKVASYLWEYSTDGNTWSANETGYVVGGASATLGVTNGSDKCNNIRPTKAGKYRLRISYKNASDEVIKSGSDVLYQESNVITITSDNNFKLKYPQSGLTNAGTDFTFNSADRTIPVIVVKTTEDFPGCPASGMPSQDVEGQKAKRSVDVKMFDKDGNLYYDRKARMNYRGSSSLNFRKKSYAFCTGKEKTKNSKGDVDTGKENLFGLSNGAKDKDWVLYAAMPDPSMMRNRLVFDTYAQMTGKWGVNSKFVELIIDDEYKGVYVLMDKITNNEKRINITDKNGFILKFDKTDVTDRYEDNNSEKRNTFKTYYTGNDDIDSYGAKFDQRFEIEYPEMEDMGDNWVEFVNDNIITRIKRFEDALAAANYSEVRNIIDYESWADWFIISEFAKNVDAYRASCLFVYNGDKIEARPLWDQELSFNNTATTVGNGKGCNNPSGLLVQNNGVYTDDFPAPFWFTGRRDNSLDTDVISGWLLNDPCFVTLVKERWRDHLNKALHKDQLDSKIGEYQTELTTQALSRETATWRPESGDITACTGTGTGYKNVAVSTSVKTMTDWITDRPDGLTDALKTLTGSSIEIKVEPSFVETHPWESFTLDVDAPEGYEYEMTFTKDASDASADMEVQKVNDTYTIKIRRPAQTLNQVFATVPYLATAKLKVDDDGCGGMTNPEANVNIRLNDREEVCE